MNIIGRLPEPQSLPQKLLPRRIHQMLLTANNVRHLHQIIVNHARKIIRRESVALQYYKIANLTAIKTHLPAHHIANNNRPLFGHRKTHRNRLAPCPGLLDFFFVRKSLRPPVNKTLLLRLRLLPHRLQLLGRIKAVICLLLIKQLLHISIVNPLLFPLGLKIRPVRPPDLRPLVPLNSKPPQIIHHLLTRRRRIALLVSVLNPQDKLAPHPPRKKPVKNRRPRTSHVQITRR